MTLRRVAELVRKVIDYEIFGILLLNEKTQELYFRFSVGHSHEVADRLAVRGYRVIITLPEKMSAACTTRSDGNSTHASPLV